MTSTKAPVKAADVAASDVANSIIRALTVPRLVHMLFSVRE